MSRYPHFYLSPTVKPNQSLIDLKTAKNLKQHPKALETLLKQIDSLQMSQTRNVTKSEWNQLLVDDQLWSQAEVYERVVDFVNPNYWQSILSVAQTVSAHKYPPFVYQLIYVFQSVYHLVSHLILAQHNTGIRPHITEDI